MFHRMIGIRTLDLNKLVRHPSETRVNAAARRRRPGRTKVRVIPLSAIYGTRISSPATISCEPGQAWKGAAAAVDSGAEV